MDFSPITNPWFYAVAIPGVILTGISKAGFGGAVGGIAVPLMVLVIDAPQAVAIMLPILCVMDLLGLFAFRRNVLWPVLRVAVIAGLAGSLLGYLLFNVVDSRWIKALIGVESVLFALFWMMQGRRGEQAPALPFSAQRTALWSSISGFTSFISHAGGPPMMRLLLPMRPAPRDVVGTMAWYFAVINAAKWLPYGLMGMLSARNLDTSLALLPVVPVGYLIGLWFLRWIKPAAFSRVAVWGLLITGLKLSWDAFM